MVQLADKIKGLDFFQAGRYVKIRTKQGGRRRLVECRCSTCGILQWRSKGKGCPPHTVMGMYCGSMSTERWVEWDELAAELTL